jgi:hypothetical protein
MAHIILASGEHINRHTWDEIEEELRSRQFTVYETQEEWRQDICARALHNTGEELDDFGSSYSFLWELSRAQWINVVPSPNRRIGQ